MTFKSLTPMLFVAPQLSKADVESAAAQGFKAIINNRPDGEEADQITAAEMEQMTRSHGMEFVHIPVMSGKIDDAAVMKMGAALDSLEGPVLAYCRTGTRSTNLWALSEAGSTDADHIMRTAKAAGYDLPDHGSAQSVSARGSSYDVVIVGLEGRPPVADFFMAPAHW